MMPRQRADAIMVVELLAIVSLRLEIPGFLKTQFRSGLGMIRSEFERRIPSKNLI